MVINLCRDQIYVDFVRFLIRKDLCAWRFKVAIIFAVPGF